MINLRIRTTEAEAFDHTICELMKGIVISLPEWLYWVILLIGLEDRMPRFWARKLFDKNVLPLAQRLGMISRCAGKIGPEFHRYVHHATVPFLFIPSGNTARADSRFVLSQWETVLLRNDVSHWLGASLESALTASLIQGNQWYQYYCCYVCRSRLV